jgi:hypothetical protein
MRGCMDNTIHVKVEVVKLWQQRRIPNVLVNEGVALTEPPVKLWDTLMVQVEEQKKEVRGRGGEVTAGTWGGVGKTCRRRTIFVDERVQETRQQVQEL